MPNEKQDGQRKSVANDDEYCAFQEVVYNGGPVDWAHWRHWNHLTPVQAAKLLFCIDPIEWEGDTFAQGEIPRSLLLKIRKSAGLLEGMSAQWSLAALVEYYGVEDTPWSMRAALMLLDAAVKERAKPAIHGITKQQALIAFSTPKNEGAVTRALENGPKWIEPARISRGQRGKGGASSMWHPVSLAVALREQKHVTLSQLDRAFVLHAYLSGWREDWAEQSGQLKL